MAKQIDRFVSKYKPGEYILVTKEELQDWLVSINEFYDNYYQVVKKTKKGQAIKKTNK